MRGAHRLVGVLMLYEIINPSDPVTIEAEDLEVARAACLLLGRGAYGLRDADDNEALPLFIFGSDEAFEAWEKAEGFSIERVMGAKLTEVIACLRSAMCCEMRDRIAIRAAVGDDPEALARYNDARRSSLNDICGRAFAIAKGMERKAAKA